MNYLDIAYEYIQKADEYLKGLIYAVAPIYKPENGDYQDVTVPLFTTLHSTSESILILLLHGGVFEADVLLRTLMEGTIKYCFLMNGSEQDRRERYEEYKVMLYEMAKLEDHFKPTEAIKIIKKYSKNSTKPFEQDILDELTVSALTSKYSSKIKYKIKSKWTYKNMLKELAENDSNYEAQLGTLTTYSMMSHFCHFDWNGVFTRQTQIEDSQEKDANIWDTLHCLRILSNVMSMELFRFAEYLKKSGVPLPDVEKMVLDILDFVFQIDEYNNKIIEEKIK